MDDRVRELLQQADWKRIALELTAYAAWKVQRWRWRTGSSQDLARGLKANDLVSEAIAAVLGGPGGSGRAPRGQRAWDPDRQPDLLAHLKTIVDSLVWAWGTSEDNQRVERYHLTEDGEEVEKSPPGPRRSFDPPRSEWSSGPPANPEQELLAREAAEAAFDTVISAVEGNDELERILDATMNGSETPADIAEATGIDVKRVYQLRRTLQLRLKAREGVHHG